MWHGANVRVPDIGCKVDRLDIFYDRHCVFANFAGGVALAVFFSIFMLYRGSNCQITSREPCSLKTDSGCLMCIWTYRIGASLIIIIQFGLFFIKAILFHCSMQPSLILTWAWQDTTSPNNRVRPTRRPPGRTAWCQSTRRLLPRPGEQELPECRCCCCC